MNFKKGFTLIELLIVVAIIGILVGITLGYLSEAKTKGSDASVKSNLGTVRSTSEIFYLDNFNSYLPVGGLTFNIGPCPSYDIAGTNMLSQNKVMAEAIAEASANGKSSACYNSGLNWAVAVGLKSEVNTSWCVDNEGVAKVVNSVPLGAINPVTFHCN